MEKASMTSQTLINGFVCFIKLVNSVLFSISDVAGQFLTTNYGKTIFTILFYLIFVRAIYIRFIKKQLFKKVTVQPEVNKILKMETKTVVDKNYRFKLIVYVIFIILFISAIFALANYKTILY